MSATWIVVCVVGVVTVGFKAAGPLLLGERPLPARVAGVVPLLAPAVLAALVVTAVAGGEREIVLDARLAGLGAAALALLLRAPILVVVVVAAAVTAGVRLVS